MKAKIKTAARVRKQLRRHVKLTFIPHDENQYRPHLIRRHGLVIVIVLVIGLQFGHSMLKGGNVLGATQPIATSDLLADTNAARVKNKLQPLTLDTKLSKAAFLKAQDMFKQQYWAHTAPDGTTPWHWFGAVGYSYDYAGENLARNFASASAVMAAWMASPEHKANILSKQYTQVGLAVVEGSYKGQPQTLVVALYGKPVDAALAGATLRTATLTAAPAVHAITPWTRIVMAAESLTPIALFCLIILTIASIVAGVAHLYRERLPKKLSQTQYRHHGAYKALGLISLVVVIISLYGGGQI